MTLSRTAVYLIVFAALNGLIAIITGSLAAHGIETMADDVDHRRTPR